MAKRRGGYTGDQRHELKFRASPNLFEQLQAMSEEREMAMAMIIRGLITKALDLGREQAIRISNE